MNKKQVLKFLEELATYQKLKWVQFYMYGEPLLNKDFGNMWIIVVTWV
jgi:hypothetical protein